MKARLFGLMGTIPSMKKNEKKDWASLQISRTGLSTGI